MGYAKERGKLEKLSEKIRGLDVYNEKNLTTLLDMHEKYSHTVRILKNKQEATFGDLYKNELEEVKVGRKALKESATDDDRQLKFVEYKNIITNAIEKTVQATKDVG